MGAGRSMSFIGTVGVVAQQGNQGGGASCDAAPSNVSMATSSSGNYDDAVIVYSINLGSSGEDALASNTGSGFSMDSGDSYAEIDFAFSANAEAMLNNNSGVLRFGCKGFIRDAHQQLGGGINEGTSWHWTMKSLSYDDGNSSAVSSVAIGGSASTSQDATSSGTGEYAQVTHNSGGRGYLQMHSDDYVQWNMRATATNACGTGLAAPDLRIKIVFG